MCNVDPQVQQLKNLVHNFVMCKRGKEVDFYDITVDIVYDNMEWRNRIHVVNLSQG